MTVDLFICLVIYLFRFVYGLFNDAVNSSDYIAWNYRIFFHQTTRRHIPKALISVTTVSSSRRPDLLQSPYNFNPVSIFFRGVKTAEKCVYTPPSIIQISNGWSCTPMSLYSFKVWCFAHVKVCFCR